jgi:predicted amidophosphoribosyltransferase
VSQENQLHDDFRRFFYDCPNCGLKMSEYAEQCPECGQNLFEAFSGTFRPRKPLFLRIVALIVLLLFVGSMIALVVSLFP